MADSELSGIAADTTPDLTDIVYAADAAGTVDKKVEVRALQAWGINSQTGTTYTVQLSDISKVIRCSNAAGCSITFPQDSAEAIPVGAFGWYEQTGAVGVTTAAGAGATVKGTGASGVGNVLYSGVGMWIKVAANTFTTLSLDSGAQALLAHVATDPAHSADKISASSTNLPGTATNVQAVIEELVNITRPKSTSNYFFPIGGPKTTGTFTTLNRCIYLPVWLRGGTLDRIGIECTTTVSTAIARLGIYNDSAGLPGTLIAEATTTADLFTATGWQVLTISAVLPTTGRYHLACVSQTAAGTIRTLTAGDLFAPIWNDSATPSATTAALITSHEASVTGALPATASVSAYGNTNNPYFLLRYSA